MPFDMTVFRGFNLQMARLLITVALLLSGPLQVRAQQGALSFHGQVVNPTCELDTAHATRLIEQTLHLPVRQGREVNVSRAVRACQADGPFLSMHFQPLASPQLQQVSGSVGVLTITYQ